MDQESLYNIYNYINFFLLFYFALINIIYSLALFFGIINTFTRRKEESVEDYSTILSRWRRTKRGISQHREHGGHRVERTFEQEIAEGAECNKELINLISVLSAGSASLCSVEFLCALCVLCGEFQALTVYHGPRT